MTVSSVSLNFSYSRPWSVVVHFSATRASTPSTVRCVRSPEMQRRGRETRETLLLVFVVTAV